MNNIIERGINKRTGEQTWLVRVVVRNANGRRKYVCRTVHGGIRDAQKVERELASMRDRHELSVPVKDTLNAYLDRWLDTHKTAVKTRTYLNDVEMLDRYIRPALGKIKLQKLTALQIQRAYSASQAQGRSASTIRRAHAVLRNALKWAVQWNLIHANPCERVMLPKLIKHETHALTPDEAVAFLAECEHDKYGVLFRLMLFTGCRPGEAIALRWCDVDLDRHTIAIRQTYSRKAGQTIISTPKTAHGNRTIPILDDNLIASLRSKRARKIAAYLKNGQPFDAECFIFTTDRGTPPGPRSLIGKHFKPTLERAGISSAVRMYDLRHSTATLLLTLDVHPKVVQEMLGHADIQLTMNTYTHVLPTLQKSAAKKLADLLSRDL